MQEEAQRFLVVEDDATVASLMVAVLEEEGVEFLVARTTREADLVLATVPVTAMAVDLTLPGTDGLTWLERLRDSEPDLVARSTLCTGSILPDEDEGRLERCGCGLLYKPFPLPEFRKVVREALARADGAAAPPNRGTERRRRRVEPDPPLDGN